MILWTLTDSENSQTLINEIYSKWAKQNYITNKTDVYHVDVIWFLDKLDLKITILEKRGYRYILVVIDDLSKFGWTVSLKNKNAQTKKTLLKIFL